MPVIERTTHGDAETMDFAREFAGRLRRGVILLTGDIGAGKTTFTRGFVSRFGSDDLVTSPTFTLKNEYRAGGVTISHFDLYRLGSAEEAYELGMEDDIASSDFSLVEWPSVGGELFDFPAIVVTISFGENENDRNIRIEGDFDERS